jgi:hypothetical protein
MFQKKRGKSSPPPAVRRLAGQSIRDEKERLTDNWLIPFYFTTVFCWVLWLVMELQVRSHQPPQPKVYLSLAIVVTGVTAIKFGRLWRQYRNLNRGERGELAVAEQLEELRGKGFRCFHDIVRDGFNIDHVVVGPPGVFVIETKFRSGSGLIEFRNGEGIFVGGREEEGDPLKQARGNARVVHDFIRQDAGLELWVKPLVVFVGDWKVKNAWRDTDIRVIMANGIARYFDRQDQPELTKREIQLICSHLNRTARVA